MTRFVDVRNMVRWATTTGPESIISGMIGYLRDDFRRWESFDKTARVASHTPLGVIELMPTSDLETYAFKYVNGHPSNPARGFQTVTAFGVLADVHNGYPTLMAEMTLLTALRTAATSAMVAQELARPDSRLSDSGLRSASTACASGTPIPTPWRSSCAISRRSDSTSPWQRAPRMP